MIQSYKENHVEEGFSEEEELVTVSEIEVSKDEEKEDKRAKEDGWERTSSKKSKLVLDKHEFMSDPSQVTWKTVNKKFKEIVAARGRKGTRWFELVEQLVFLAKVAKTHAQKLEILLGTVSAQFDAGIHGHMPVQVWMRRICLLFSIFWCNIPTFVLMTRQRFMRTELRIHLVIMGQSWSMETWWILSKK